jgi:hypothetical protein
VQVHGGTGYVDDAEISQVYRDSRIGPIRPPTRGDALDASDAPAPASANSGRRA